MKEPKDGRRTEVRPGTGVNRRRLVAGVATAGAAGWAMAHGQKPSAPASPDGEARGRARYRETEHVRTAYRLARF